MAFIEIRLSLSMSMLYIRGFPSFQRLIDMLILVGLYDSERDCW